MGPVIIDIEGLSLQKEDVTLLQNPNVGGVILFSRNYESLEQLKALTTSIRKVRSTPLVICVDQEGGRVQRFRDGFTQIPAANTYQHKKNGERLAFQAGWLMATELLAAGVDFSFAPVLDIGEQCAAIGDRSFGKTKEDVEKYAEQFSLGMKHAGMSTTGKHFPGHGGVLQDSHLETPIDNRKDIQSNDMAIFESLINKNLLDAIMPAHVIYSAHDPLPASGSPYWLQSILREKLNYKGIIFSDDLNMKGADVMGNYGERAIKALEAGCDVLLLCNNRIGLLEMLAALPSKPETALHLLKSTKLQEAAEAYYSDAANEIRASLATL